ncbi:MAG: serine/threonine protein kinase [Muribaculaceae bacterium]|nr:serine/threonine protein kinase [Muribaculaceae bacterium]
MAELAPGTIIQLTNGKSCRIIEELGRGGQGIVYKVDYDGKPHALKWYIINNKPAFYANLENNVKNGAPNESFLWPLAISSPNQYGSRGYVMKLRPQNYEEIGAFMLAKVRFASPEALIEAAIQICSAFQKLHIIGLSYQDMNDGNFFIDPSTGDVLICDNDNVAPNKVNMGIVGKSGYMAPEIVDKEAMPDRYTDYFSLGVILFILFYLNRPFEGKRVINCPCITEEAERKLFGRGCVFIMDPVDDSNRPDPRFHKNVMRRWPYFPRLLRETFIKAFGKEAIQNPTKRVMDKTWQQVLLQIRAQYVSCPHCGRKTFIEPDSEASLCINCRNRVERPIILKIGNYRIPLLEGQKIYRCQSQASMNVDLSEVYGIIIKNPTNGKLGIKNISGVTWAVTLPNGEIRNVEDGRGLPAIADLKIKFNHDVTALTTL